MRSAIITGSTGGIGAEIARRLAGEGMAVVVSGRRAEAGERVAAGIRANGGAAAFCRADVSDPQACAELIRFAVDRFGRLDVLVNNAASFPAAPFDQIRVEQWDAEFAVNVRAAFLCSRDAIPHMRRQGGGSIVNMGTTVVYRSRDLDRLGYACSKGALLTMTQTMARALAADRIRVNWVAVGWVPTPGEIELRDRLHGDGQAYLRERAEQSPMGRLESAAEIAAGVAYLVSDEASHVTGCELNISGGLWV